MADAQAKKLPACLVFVSAPPTRPHFEQFQTISAFWTVLACPESLR